MADTKHKRRPRHRSGALDLIQKGTRFLKKNHRLPTLKDLGVSDRTIFYHFGSFQDYLDHIASFTAPAERYCRQCGERLRGNYFFCGEACQLAYMEQHIPLQVLDIIERHTAPEKEKELAPQCRGCSAGCPVLVEVGTDPLTYKIWCPKHPSPKEVS